jgi:hypothetical protein
MRTQNKHSDILTFFSKHILIGRSCVFFAMFNGPLAETSEEIALPDIEPNVFRILLQ